MCLNGDVKEKVWKSSKLHNKQSKHKKISFWIRQLLHQFETFQSHEINFFLITNHFCLQTINFRPKNEGASVRTSEAKTSGRRQPQGSCRPPPISSPPRTPKYWTYWYYKGYLLTLFYYINVALRLIHTYYHQNCSFFYRSRNPCWLSFKKRGCSTPISEKRGCTAPLHPR